MVPTTPRPAGTDPESTLDSGDFISYFLTPRASVRRDYYRDLYRTYSLKLRRFIDLYDAIGFASWVVLLESDPDVRTFNIEPLPVSVPLPHLDAGTFSPDFISVSRAEKLTIWTLEPASDADSSKLPLWSDWCDKRGFEHRSIGEKELRTSTCYVANLSRLLHFICHPDYIPNFTIEQMLIFQLKQVRKLTIYALATALPKYDINIVIQEIARLILNRKIYGDIENVRLSLITEISLYQSVLEQTQGRK